MIGPAGQWLGASVLLGRPVLVAERYPHVCRLTLPSSGLRTETRDCPACVAHRAPARQG